MNNTKNVRVAGAYVTGKSHIAKNIPCQDRTYSKTLNGTTVIALADGAGSCSKSDIGAEIATQFVAEFICSNFDKIYEKEEKSASKTILDGVQKCLNQKANEIKLDIKELSSTILFVVVKNNKYLAGHIGDGLIGYFDANEDAKILSYPYNEGEYTVFTTNTHALENFRIYKENLNDIKGFVLMSDGTCDSLYDVNDKKLTEANKKIFGLLNDHRVSIKIIEEQIIKTIKSKFLDKSINGDDCSINLLALTDSLHISSIDKVKVSEKPDLTSNLKQLADNTKRIDQLQSEINSVKNKLPEYDKKSAKKAEKDNFKEYELKLDQLISEQSKDIRKIDKLKKDINLFQNELSELRDGSTDNHWKQNVNTLLIIAYLGLGILTVIITKLLFFNEVVTLEEVVITAPPIVEEVIPEPKPTPEPEPEPEPVVEVEEEPAVIVEEEVVEVEVTVGPGIEAVTDSAETETDTTVVPVEAEVDTTVKDSSTLLDINNGTN